MSPSDLHPTFFKEFFSGKIRPIFNAEILLFELLKEVVAYVGGQSIIGKINFDQRFVESKSIGKFLDLVEAKIAEFEVQGSQVVILVLHTSAKVVKALET